MGRRGADLRAQGSENKALKSSSGCRAGNTRNNYKNVQVLRHARASVAGPREHHAKGKRPVTKDHRLLDSSYVNYPEKANPWRPKADSRLPGNGGGGWGVTT